MFAGSDDLLVVCVLKPTLQTRNEVRDIALNMESIFGWDLEPTAPARVREGLTCNLAAFEADVGGLLTLMLGVQKSNPD